LPFATEAWAQKKREDNVNRRRTALKKKSTAKEKTTVQGIETRMAVKKKEF